MRLIVGCFYETDSIDAILLTIWYAALLLDETIVYTTAVVWCVRSVNVCDKLPQSQRASPNDYTFRYPILTFELLLTKTCCGTRNFFDFFY